MLKQIVLSCLILVYIYCQGTTAACSNQGTLVSGYEDLPISNQGNQNPSRNLQSYSLQELQTQLSDTIRKLSDLQNQYEKVKSQSINNPQIDLTPYQSDMKSLNQRITYLQNQIDRLRNGYNQPQFEVISQPITSQPINWNPTGPFNPLPPYIRPPPPPRPPKQDPVISQPTQSKVNCVVTSPPQQFLEQSKKTVDFAQSQKIAQAQRQSKAKWISPPSFLAKPFALNFTFQSSCIYNPCPENPYTLLVIASCPFKVYAVTQANVLIQYIGSGSPWSWSWYTFKIPCGKFKIKIVLNCPNSNVYIWFDLTQNSHNCTDCRNPLTQYFDPYTCKCQCSNRCQCNKNQIWYDYPSCYCGCAKMQKCDPVQQFWNAQTCRCQCLPICCDPWANPGPPCC